jgi:hypothetical protein
VKWVWLLREARREGEGGHSPSPTVRCCCFFLERKVGGKKSEISFRMIPFFRRRMAQRAASDRRRDCLGNIHRVVVKGHARLVWSISTHVGVANSDCRVCIKCANFCVFGKSDFAKNIIADQSGNSSRSAPDGLGGHALAREHGACGEEGGGGHGGHGCRCCRVCE